jgi:hypothetical protein
MIIKAMIIKMGNRSLEQVKAQTTYRVSNKRLKIAALVWSHATLPHHLL